MGAESAEKKTYCPKSVTHPFPVVCAGGPGKCACGTQEECGPDREFGVSVDVRHQRSDEDGAANSVDQDGREAAGPKPGAPAETPEEREEHHEGEWTEGVKVEGLAPVAFGQGAEGPRQTAQRAGASRQPVKRAEA